MLNPSEFVDEERVIGAQAHALMKLRAQDDVVFACLQESISRAESLAACLKADLPTLVTTIVQPAIGLAPSASFADLVAAAPLDTGLHDALAEDEIEATLARLYATGRQSETETNLDRWDWAVAGMAGLLAGAADLALVGMPSTSAAKLAPLPKLVHAMLERALPPKTVRRLEAAYKVSFDASTNRNLTKRVAGLFPRTHRFQSLGHDPLLGWIFGARDVLNGSFTAIGTDGKLVIQTTTPDADGQALFIGLIEAFQQVGGHLLSDVSTKAGLPAPLMPLLQFVQCGSFGKKKRTVADLARYMYLRGYDFRHFAAGNLSAAIVEVVVRGAWIARRLGEGSALRDGLPDDSVPRLRRQLLLGHATAAAVNAGKIAIKQNPLALNWAQWLALLRHLGPEVLYQVHEPVVRAATRDAMLDADLRDLAAPARAATVQ